jgi:predicted dehydrogenase
MKATKIGIIGCGNISGAYLRGGARSDLVNVIAVADINHEAAVAKAQEFGVEAITVDELLAHPDIEIVVNITVPLAHAEVSHSILQSGKHVYSEKPLAATFDEARSFMAVAKDKGLHVGCAPDTFMGGAHQAARHAIDEDRIGQVVAGSACVLNHGMEGWHPNPEFFYKRGGGPILDLGPYYITQLVNLLGPVRRVAGLASIGSPVRTITSEPRRGQKISVDVPTTINGILDFECGANIALTATWDVWKNERRPFELYGVTGSMLVPDPNFFGGEVLISEADGDWQSIGIEEHPFGTPNRKSGRGIMVADYRMIGLIDMACAIRSGRAFRANGQLALHVLEVMCAFERSSITGQHVQITTGCERPAAVPRGNDETVFVY